MALFCLRALASAGRTSVSNSQIRGLALCSGSDDDIIARRTFRIPLGER